MEETSTQGVSCVVSLPEVCVPGGIAVGFFILVSMTRVSSSLD